MKYLFKSCIIILVLFGSCKKEDSAGPPVEPPGEPPVEQPMIRSDFSIQFDNRIKDRDLHLQLETYTTEIYAEQFTLTTVKYYISNIILTNTGDTTYTIPQDSSYFLIDESVFNSQSVKLKVPVGDYKTLTFMIGVDSMRSTMDISLRTGVLDPTTGANGMYWGWNSGYIFFKVEGVSPSSPEDGNVIMYHIGGFGGYSTPTINNLATVSLDLTPAGIAQVRTGRKSNVHLMADISRIFDNRGQPVRIASYPVVMFDEFSSNIVYNYTGMFRHDHTEN